MLYVVEAVVHRWRAALVDGGPAGATASKKEDNIQHWGKPVP
jgi:hypothetical protein